MKPQLPKPKTGMEPPTDRVSPSVGDQHRGGPTAINMPNGPGPVLTNPFEEPERRMSEYTAMQIATLQARLDTSLRDLVQRDRKYTISRRINASTLQMKCLGSMAGPARFRELTLTLYVAMCYVAMCSVWSECATNVC